MLLLTPCAAVASDVLEAMGGGGGGGEAAGLRELVRDRCVLRSMSMSRTWSGRKGRRGRTRLLR
ncbi:hypothetical protein QJS04_geneDACA005281 [Acorus gramineus]|uniref:Uncharacterized protein n=1 Tax=Acorus gramineus TaxID=55184 RepID=A0AAV9AZA7_ACOGR|nr:hypothetical protein QJS04_geneDACA005281 [Acorus gramineus]